MRSCSSSRSARTARTRATLALLLAVACGACALAVVAAATAAQRLIERLNEPLPYTKLPEAEFDQFGWNLPDGGQRVKRVADAAPGGAFDPRLLEQIPAGALGYRARWHVVRYRHYGLDWDITGLELTPVTPLPQLPTLAIIHGGSANWYEFFLDPFNDPGLAQYLAQKVRVLLITIPGNYKPGGWAEPPERRVAPYVIDGKMTDAEVKLRTAVFTTRLVAEGVRRLIEKAVSGPVVVVGHSTGGEIPFLLQETGLKSRLGGVFLGWGSGGPARVLEEEAPQGEARRAPASDPVWRLRVRTPEEYANTYSYVGPLNPVKAPTRLEVARGWFAREGRRRPHFKQVLQDAEHRPGVGSAAELARQIRLAAQDYKSSADAGQAIADLFATHRVSLTGFRRMLWIVAGADTGHWKPERPEGALEMLFANRFRRDNPGAMIRVMALDLPMSHYGHIERPRQLAGVFVSSLEWLGARQTQTGGAAGTSKAAVK